MDEREIIKKIANGDEESFIKIVDMYKNKVFTLCFSYTRDHHDAEDLSQEVFISFYKSARGFRGDSAISTYIYRIALSKSMDYLRKRKIKNIFMGLIPFNNREYNIDIDDKNYIRQSILSLKEELKTPLILYYYIGLSQKEIADVLNISQKNVEGRIYRAKTKLKKEFEKEVELLCSKNGI